MAECDSNSENDESGIIHACTSPSRELSITDDSCITSNSTTTLTSNGNHTHLPFIQVWFFVYMNTCRSTGQTGLVRTSCSLVWVKKCWNTLEMVIALLRSVF